MKTFIKFGLLLFILFSFNQVIAVNYFNQNELDIALKSGPIGVAKVSVTGDESTRTGSAMIYRFEDKVIGITVAHTFDKALEKNPNEIKGHVNFNLSYNTSQVIIPISLIKFHPDYKPFTTIFDERDPIKVKNDIAIFSIPYFSEKFMSNLFELHLDSSTPQLNEYKARAYSYGPYHTTNLDTFYTPTRSPQSVDTTIYYDDSSGLFKQDYESNRLLITINKISHKIDFAVLINEASKVTSLPGDSGANLIESASNSAIAMFSHHDYMNFFQKNSPLTRFYFQYAIQPEPSQQRTFNFIENLTHHGQILDVKDINNEKYIAFQSTENISCSTLLTPLYLHHVLIMNFISVIPKTLLLNDYAFYQKFL